MGSLVKRGWATGFSLLRRISDIKSTRNCADRNLIARMMMSTAVNSSPSSGIMSPPWLMLPPVFEEGGDMIYKFYNLSEDKEESFRKKRSEQMADAATAKFVGSSHGWLALFNQRNNHLFLYNPITNRQIKLPPIETLPDPHINLAPNGRSFVRKLILSSSPDDDDECIAMMIFGPERRLAFCHPVTALNGLLLANIIIILEMKACFRVDDLECWDLTDSLSPRIHLSWDLDCSDLTRYPKRASYSLVPITQLNLVYVEEYNQLFLVVRCVMERMGPDGLGVSPIYYGKNKGWDNSFPYQTTWFDASKIDFAFEKPQCLEGSLDGLAMFIGLNHSIAMSLTTKSKLNSNCIYYTDSNDLPIPPSSFYGGHDIGIFDYTNRTISPCYDFPLDIKCIKRIMPAPMWFTPCQH
ncbi:hypothetical protein CASFOL_001139 [Castilleja foliolosa]|uniref:KIB1-4 beta-propeller domain-containing protein n=1 Tax=Castilleja foliolosa TaxID=1961234 RepID=A0ABD3ELZ9_9LAMI